MLDFHSHILPGLDDGAPDMDTAIEMARIAVEDGITAMVATPHYIEGSMENHRDLILQKVVDFQEELREEGISLKVIPGSEVYLSPETPARLDKGELMTINNGGKYLLVELPMQSVPVFAEDVIFELKIKGITPIIAHPERNLELARKPERILEFAAKGCLLQVNSGSITGLYGQKARKMAEMLVKSGTAHLIGSDAHSARGRSPRIIDAYQNIKKLRPGKMKEIVEYSEKVVSGIDVYHREPVQDSEQSKGFWKKLRSLDLFDRVFGKFR